MTENEMVAPWPFLRVAAACLAVLGTPVCALAGGVQNTGEISTNFTACVVAAFAHPVRAAAQAFGRTQNFRSGMVFIAYSY